MATYLGHQEDSSGNILLPTPHSMATQIEFGTKASQAYAKGAYVVFNNRLCKASKAIASGDTLAIGTNLVQCSIGSELNSHLQAPNGNEFYFDYKDGKPGFYPSASKVASEFVPFGGSLSNTDHTYASGGTGATSVDVSYTLPKGKGIAIVTKYGYPYSQQPFTPTITSGTCTLRASYTDAYYQTGILDVDSSDGATLTVNVYYGYTGGGHPEAQLMYLY